MQLTEFRSDKHFMGIENVTVWCFTQSVYVCVFGGGILRVPP